MLYAGLDLSRKRLDFHLLDAEGATVEVGASADRQKSHERRMVTARDYAASATERPGATADLCHC